MWKKGDIEALLKRIYKEVPNHEYWLIAPDYEVLIGKNSILKLIIAAHPTRTIQSSGCTDARLFYHHFMTKVVLPFYWLPTVRSQNRKNEIMARTNNEFDSYMKGNRNIEFAESWNVQLNPRLFMQVVFYPDMDLKEIDKDLKDVQLHLSNQITETAGHSSACF